MNSDYNKTMGLSFGTARKKYHCFNSPLHEENLIQGDTVLLGNHDPKQFVVPRALWDLTKGGHYESHKHKATEGRKNKQGLLLQYMSRKFEHAIPHRIDIPINNTDMSRLSRSAHKLLSVCGQQNKRIHTTRRTTRSNIEPALARCQAARNTNKETMHKNSAIKFTEHTKIQNTSIALSYIDFIGISTQHNIYSVN